MKVEKFGYTIEQPSLEETGNVYCKASESTKNIVKLMKERKLNGFIEPNVGHMSTLIEVSSFDTALNLNPWNADFIKCDAVKISRDYLRLINFGLFARSADCMMLALLSENDVYLLHISVQSLNDGILQILSEENIDCTYVAVEGPCISAEKYFLYGEEYIEKNICNFSNLGYDKHIYYNDENLHVDIRGIVREELMKRGIKTLVSNNQCTYKNTKLGSNRRDGKNRHDNVMIITA